MQFYGYVLNIKMTASVEMEIIIALIAGLMSPVLGQVTCPAPQAPSQLSYVADPTNACSVRVCYLELALPQVFSCPTDATYLQLLQNSNLLMFNACSGCLTAVVTTTPSPVITSSSVVITTTAVKTVVDVQHDSHIIGGRFVGASLSIIACQTLCIQDPACLAFDHDSRGDMCWFHDSVTACNPLQPKTFCIHYKLTTCGATTVIPTIGTATPITTTPAVTTTLPITTTPAVTTTLPTVTTSVVTTPAPTTVPTATTPVVTGPVTTTVGTGVPNGFVSVTPGSHIAGGLRTLAFVSEQQCLDFCLMESFCLAVDYNFLLSTCYIHFRDTYCNAVAVEIGTSHYQRLPCVNNPLVGDFAFEMRNKFHVLGGILRGSGVSLIQCLTLCYQDNTCQGVDYDMAAGTCYTFTTTNVCDPLLPKDNCIHVSIQQCTIPPALGVTTPSPVTTAVPIATTAFVAPIGSFVQLVFAGPSTLPSGWQAYPGMQVNNGAPIGAVGISGDQCIQLCFANPNCHAVDFNSFDGTCYAHDLTQKCNIPVAINEVYHAKRNPVCTLISGTTTPYPSPLAIAP